MSTRMALPGPFLLCVLALTSLLATTNGAKPSPYSIPFNRTIFPASFIFGAGTAAYQVEGAAHIDGKGPSIWDTFTKKHPEKIADGSNGLIALDFYHRYKEDIKLMKKIGLDSFRFSISWPRVLPTGKISGGVNPLGVKYYNDLINELLANGIKPFVTIFHFDLPQALYDEYKGLLSPKFVNDYKEYAEFCFKTFGDRVKYWSTANEPYHVYYAFGAGTFAPGRCSNYIGNCTYGNSATEPYIAAHHLLLGHATVVKLYKQKYQASQKGIIGITLVTNYYVPRSQIASSKKAALRSIDFMLGWFAHPIIYGYYPPTMQKIVGKRLPKFTTAESKLLKGSIDFLGINYYTSSYAENGLTSSANLSATTDSHVTLSTTNNLGVPIGTATGLSWLYVYPKGIYDLMLYIKDVYKNPPIFINENGVATLYNASIPIKTDLKDGIRIRYMHDHLSYLAKAMKEGVNLKGYYAWSFWDDFEWDAGKSVRFGLVYIDWTNGLKRYLKYSAYWFKNFLLK